MSEERAPSPVRTTPARSWVPAFLAALVVALLLLGSSPSVRGSAPSAGSWSGGTTWTNGITTAEFLPHLPGVTVAAVDGDSGYGLYAGLGGLGEYTPGGQLVAAAQLSGAHWSALNLSTPQEMVMDYAASVPVGSSPSSAVHLQVNFTEGADGAPASISPTTVTFTIAEQGWPWSQSGDVLGVLLPLWPSNDSLEHIDTTVHGQTMNCLTNDSGRASEFFGWGGAASARGPSGQLAALTPSALVSGSGEYVPLVVLLEGSPGGYRSMSYDPQVGIIAGSVAGSVPLAALGVSLATASAGVFLAALLLGRVQRHSPSLEGADGSEP
ncbi:MAG: hypothetical protein L3K04_04595 [Thermoplasmata archaeon]|nr:hypothetical protein [Thermoplasmata archaeon]